jgi:hypothetical protein
MRAPPTATARTSTTRRRRRSTSLTGAAELRPRPLDADGEGVARDSLPLRAQGRQLTNGAQAAYAQARRDDPRACQLRGRRRNARVPSSRSDVTQAVHRAPDRDWHARRLRRLGPRRPRGLRLPQAADYRPQASAAHLPRQGHPRPLRPRAPCAKPPSGPDGGRDRLDGNAAAGPLGEVFPIRDDAGLDHLCEPRRLDRVGALLVCERAPERWSAALTATACRCGSRGTADATGSTCAA